MDNFNTTISCLYQTQGAITHENIRSRFLDYQIADINIHPDIPLPATGYHPISIKISGVWYEAVASIVTTPTEGNNKRVKVYIHNFEQRLQACNVLLSWNNYVIPSTKQKRQNEAFPAAISL
ncbi:riboflavin kinase [Oceanobacillus sp. AG]|uniref:riboflavin kinase n=1 Tax=Oceanobacillus sp. AG TaxID=2681969 RepID=UPI0012EC7587|nr:riboflavin kinase [Oceanobacillus sp. AG]